MKTDKVVLNKDEAGWFSRNVKSSLRILAASEPKNPGVTERSSYKLLKSMEEMATEAESILNQVGEEPCEIELYMSRKQKLTVRELIKRTHGSLVTKIIPTYRERGNHQEYLVRAEKKAEMLDAMQRKFK